MSFTSSCASDLEITERKGTATIRSGKGNKYRVVPLNKDARNALTNYIEHARPTTDSEKVFIGQRGALTRNGVYKIVSRLGEKAIGKKVFPHMLRHQCFTTMAKNPAVDLKTIHPQPKSKTQLKHYHSFSIHNNHR